MVVAVVGTRCLLFVICRWLTRERGFMFNECRAHVRALKQAPPFASTFFREL